MFSLAYMIVMALAAVLLALCYEWIGPWGLLFLLVIAAIWNMYENRRSVRERNSDGPTGSM